MSIAYLWAKVVFEERNEELSKYLPFYKQLHETSMKFFEKNERLRCLLPSPGVPSLVIASEFLMRMIFRLRVDCFVEEGWKTNVNASSSGEQAASSAKKQPAKWPVGWFEMFDTIRYE